MFRLGLALFVLAVPSLGFAQDPVPTPLPVKPMTPFVVDARGTMASLSQDAGVAAALGVQPNSLPSRGFGFVLGAHVYPLRAKSIALGVGAEFLRSGGSNTVDALIEGGEDGPTINTRWSQFSPQVSLNFGKRDGWSYLTVGYGRSNLTMERDDLPQEDAESGASTLNYGGGARWFMKKRLAFTFDVRFYSVSAQDATEGRIATPQMRIRVLSAGISVR